MDRRLTASVTAPTHALLTEGLDLTSSLMTGITITGRSKNPSVPNLYGLIYLFIHKIPSKDSLNVWNSWLVLGRKYFYLIFKNRMIRSRNIDTELPQCWELFGSIGCIKCTVVKEENVGLITPKSLIVNIFRQVLLVFR